MRLEKLIDNAKVVSFDIFDTLIWRIYAKPTDLFRHLEEAVKRNGFAKARVAAKKSAQMLARKSGKSVVTLDGIYQVISGDYCDLKEKEIEMQLHACRGNPYIRSVYEYAKQKQKKIVITSEMYLPQNVIEEILKNAGFTDYEKLFLSCTTGKTKANGTLYEELIGDTGVLPQEILHIGAHMHADVQMAREKGLTAYHYTQSRYSDCQMMHASCFCVFNQYADEGTALSILQGLIRENDEKKKDYWYHFGFNYMGILAYGYVKWLKEQFDAAGIKKAYFMLRNGSVFRKVFEKLYPDFEVHEVLGELTDDWEQLHLLEEKAELVDFGWDFALKEIKNQSYAGKILELAFCAAHPEICKGKKTEQGDVPVYQNIPEEKQRIEAGRLILDGILDFAGQFGAIDRKYPLEINLHEAFAPVEYLADHGSWYDRKKISEISFYSDTGAGHTYYPISPNGKITIGVINPWPGDISAELEVVERIRQAAKDSGIGFVALDDFGCILDEKQKRTDRYIKPSELDFAISTHYETHKSIDTFYYHTLWNPPEIPLNLDYYYERVTNNYIMNDDFLIYGSGGMTDHLKSMLYRKPRNLCGASMLTASCPESYMLKPNLNHPLMFYCGMNWEKVVHHTNRHEGLFKLLDKTGKVNFYGPDSVKAWGGLRPWDGYACYKGPIPFDGRSILKEVNRCGICLVLSSDIHRRAGAATNRVYEACTAGAVIISDENEFMLRWFKDAALFIDYNKNDPKDTFRQIMEKYDWIVQHKEEALALAKKAQDIFRKNFALDKQLYQLVNHHASRFRSISKDLFAKDDTQRVTVNYVAATLNKKKAHQFLKQVVRNVENQYYRNISICVACDHMIYEDIRCFLSKITARAQVYPMEIFDKKGSQKLTNGECISRLWKLADGKYMMIAVADEIWFYDHVTTLVRTIEDEHAVAAYSGRLALHRDRLRRVDSFKPITNNTVYHMQYPDWLPTPGQVLFSEKAKTVIPDYMFSCLDGYEHYAILALYKLKKRQKLSFSRRMTYVTKVERKDTQCHILETAFQIRFIRDLVQEDMIEDLSRGNGVSAVNRREINEMLAFIPVRLWLRLRFCLKKFRHINLNTKKGKRIEKQYHELLEKFLNM